VIYTADLDGLAALVGFLVEDCCGGSPEACSDAHPLLARIADHSRRKKNAMQARTYNVLILCTGNSARSILAEAILNRLGEGRFRAFSAGSQPKGEVHPEARDLLAEFGYDVSWLRSKRWDEFARPGSPEMDFVITVCDSAAGEACPVWPGRPTTAHWGVPDPAAASGSPAEIRTAFAETYRLLHDRIAALVSLPLEDLGPPDLKTRLREIGAMTGATSPAR
jgi:arsenate reductase